MSAQKRSLAGAGSTRTGALDWLTSASGAAALMYSLAGQYLGTLPVVGSLDLQYLLGLLGMLVVVAAFPRDLSLPREPSHAAVASRRSSAAADARSRGTATSIAICGACAVVGGTAIGLALAGMTHLLEIGFVGGQVLALAWLGAGVVRWSRARRASSGAWAAGRSEATQPAPSSYRPPSRWREPINLVAIALAAATLVVIELAPDHRWLALWALVVFAVIGLLPFPGGQAGDDRVMNLASAVLGVPVAVRRATRARIVPGEVPAEARRAARILALVVVLLIAVLFA